MEEKILFVGPRFFGFENDIIETLKKKYHQVFYKCEYPFNNPRLYYIIENLCYPLASSIMLKHEDSIKRLIQKENINKIFIIRGKHLSEELLRFMCDIGVKLYHYQWDSVRNNHNAIMLSKYCNFNYTFDREDASNYQNFQYLPLFYCWRNLSKLEKEPVYDIFYLASYNILRHNILKELRLLSLRENFKFKHHLYLPFILYLRLLFKGKWVSLRDISFRKYSRKKYFYTLCNSKMVFDAPSPQQTGSSIRTVETLSLGRKLITTNHNVKNELFYSENNIIFWPEDKDKIRSAIENKFDVISNKKINSLEQWIEEIGL